MIRTLIQEAVDAGARRWRACEVLGLSVRTVERWGANDEDGRHGPNHVPANKFSEAERQKAIDVMTSPEFRDFSTMASTPRPRSDSDLCERSAHTRAMCMLDLLEPALWLESMQPCEP